MIYLCIPSHNEASTIGVLLWKIRKVFADFSREYQIVVMDDGSTDGTAAVLEPYQKVLPLTVLQQKGRLGYGKSVEALLRYAVGRTDRPKRDCAVLLQSDFTHDPSAIPDFLRRLESGADLVVGDATLAEAPRAYRFLRRWGPRLFRRAAAVPDVRDLFSGFLAVRLVAVRNLSRDVPDGVLLHHDGWAAAAELCGRLARYARRVEAVPIVERHDLRQRPSRIQPWAQVRALWRASRQFTIPDPPPRPPARPRGRRRSPAEVTP